MGTRKRLPRTPTVASLGWFWTPPKLPDTSCYSKLSFALTVSFFSPHLQCRKKWQNEFATEVFWQTNSAGSLRARWDKTLCGGRLLPQDLLWAFQLTDLWTLQKSLFRSGFNWILSFPRTSGQIFLLLIDHNLCCMAPVLESHWLTGEWGKSGLLLHTLISKTQSHVWHQIFSNLPSCFVLSYIDL